MIAVVGSNNVDLVLTVDHFTQPGETQRCLSYERFPGGKGANQAVACKKLTAEVYFLTCVGNDGNGEFSFETLTRAGLRDGLVHVELPNGFAMIEVTRDGQNRIIIFPGANAAMNVKLVQKHLNELLRADILLLQNEIPFEVNLEVARRFKEKGKLVIFDPAPATGVQDEIYSYVDIITPNESEAHQLTGKFGESAAQELLKRGCANVLLKMGENGCYFTGTLGTFRIDAFKVEAVDTTAAGDVFNAAFAVWFERTGDLKKALLFATAAAAISVTRPGAQSSVPSLEEVIGFLRERRVEGF
ncbi:MAG: Ribokinase [Thermotoga sp. 50_1627]|nr:MAG: Ribokinase [Thermotoga sp. 50_1627]HBT39441.1 ribokinase [Pseudothermotoga sp.]